MKDDEIEFALFIAALEELRALTTKGRGVSLRACYQRGASLRWWIEWPDHGAYDSYMAGEGIDSIHVAIDRQRFT